MDITIARCLVVQSRAPTHQTLGFAKFRLQIVRDLNQQLYGRKTEALHIYFNENETTYFLLFLHITYFKLFNGHFSQGQICKLS